MSHVPTRSGLQLRSLVKPEGELEVSLVSVPTPTPAPDEVLVRIEASPLNPSDIGLLFGAADLSTVKASGTAASPVVTMRISPAAMRAMAGRAGESMPVGNEGAGVVIEAGSSPAAQALLGKTVSVLGGAMYSQYLHPLVDILRPFVGRRSTTALGNLEEIIVSVFGAIIAPFLYEPLLADLFRRDVLSPAALKRRRRHIEALVELTLAQILPPEA